MRLQAYVWPDDVARMQRLRGALELARQVPASVVRADAASFLEKLSPQPGSTLVIWHSVVWQYLPDDARVRVRAELDRIGAEATRSSPVAHLSLELDPGSDDANVALRLWPASAFPTYAADTPIGDAAPHGVPVLARQLSGSSWRKMRADCRPRPRWAQGPVAGPRRRRPRCSRPDRDTASTTAPPADHGVLADRDAGGTIAPPPSHRVSGRDRLRRPPHFGAPRGFDGMRRV